MKVGDVICVADFNDLCPRLCRKVGVMEFRLNQTVARNLSCLVPKPFSVSSLPFSLSLLFPLLSSILFPFLPFILGS